MLQELELEDEPHAVDAEIRAVDLEDRRAANVGGDARGGGANRAGLELREAQWRTRDGASSSFIDRIDCSVPTSAGFTR